MLLLVLPLCLFAGGSIDSSTAAATPGTPVEGEPFVDHLFSTPAEYEAATGSALPAFNESPMMTERVEAGELPALTERLPKDVQVVRPPYEYGSYGGPLHDYAYPESGGYFSLMVEAQVQGLGTYPPDTRVIYPNLVKSWEQSNEFKTFTLYLREGMKWSDGDDFTADDFVFYYEDVLKNPDLTPTVVNQYKPGGGQSPLV